MPSWTDEQVERAEQRLEQATGERVATGVIVGVEAPASGAGAVTAMLLAAHGHARWEPRPTAAPAYGIGHRSGERPERLRVAHRAAHRLVPGRQPAGEPHGVRPRVRRRLEPHAARRLEAEPRVVVGVAQQDEGRARRGRARRRSPRASARCRSPAAGRRAARRPGRWRAPSRPRCRRRPRPGTATAAGGRRSCAGAVHGDERQPAVGRLVPDPVDDVGLLRPEERRELHGADRGDVAGVSRRTADRERRAGPRRPRCVSSRPPCAATPGSAARPAPAGRSAGRAPACRSRAAR